MKLFHAWAALFVAAAACNAGAQSQTNNGLDALGWLQRMNQAARSVNFSGVFVYESRGRSETSRVTHLVDASGDHEKIETLEGGPPREIVRTNDEVMAYLPQDRLIIIDRAETGRFPGRLLNAIGALSDYYTIRLGDTGKLADRDVQQIVLEPRDEMRYGHELWLDVASGLLVKARVINEKGGAVEQFSFKELTVGANVDRDSVKPRYNKATDWRVVNARGQDVRAEDINLRFRGLPSGFRQVSFVRRPLKRDGPEAFHAVFSDGLATISVFIEPQAGRTMSMPPSTASAGAIGIYKRGLADYQITAIGEVPLRALQRAADGVELRKR
jgi:sigma-E factor negative regulatory protein RseB